MTTQKDFVLPSDPLPKLPVRPKGFAVLLGAVPNRDFRRTTVQGSVRFKPVWMPTESLAQARADVRRFISEMELGGGNLVPAFVTENGKYVAKISYNGSIWEVGEDGKETGKKLES